MTRTPAPTARRRARRAALCTALATLTVGIAAGPADATGSAYPGETLSLAQTGPAVVGQPTNLVATGQQTDVGSYVGGFNFEVFQKDPAVDPTCAPDYIGERNTWIADIGNESHPVIGGYLGGDDTFSYPFKVVPAKAGPTLLCAYSDWASDTAAAAQITINAVGGALPGPVPPLPLPPGPGKPVNTKKPKVARSGKKLTCSPGTWSNASSYAYSWSISGSKKHKSGQRLSVARSLRGHSLRCAVTATGAGGKATATTSPFHVH